MNASPLTRWRRNFFAGLAIVLPGVVSVLLIIWLFFTVSKVTDTLLIFVPRSLTHHPVATVTPATPDKVPENAGEGDGELYWYWRVVALIVAVALVTVIGLVGKNYFGVRLIEGIDALLCRVPLFNKIYGTTKQVNEAFGSGNKTSFQTVVMIEYPRPGIYTVGFLTGEVQRQIEPGQLFKLHCVFIPTTPNPTSGFLVLVPEAQITRLDMSVTDGFKFIVSLGAISPDKAALLRPGVGPPALAAAPNK